MSWSGIQVPESLLYSYCLRKLQFNGQDYFIVIISVMIIIVLPFLSFIVIKYFGDTGFSLELC